MPEQKKLIQFKNIVKSFEDGQVVLKGVSLDIYENEFVTLLGPSGCGKTTLLRILGGFLQPTEGKVLFDGEDIVNVPPYKREINTVFQKYALFPHMNVYDNIAFGLTIKKEPKDVIAQKVMRMLRLVSLEDYADRNVTELSGGQQQRIAIARALVNEPSVLLLDEPLGALDLKMRKEMQLELKEMHRKLGITFIYVTHDQEEALTMSDTIVVMKDGMIQQVGTPTDIYNEPANAFVADFIGESNIFSGTITGARKVRFLNKVFDCVDDFEKNEKVDVVVRPEDVVLTDKGTGMVDGVITSSVFKGVHYEMTFTVGKTEVVIQDTVEKKAGEAASISIAPDSIHIMKKEFSVNRYDGYITKKNTVCFGDGEFECDVTQLYPGSALDEEGYLITAEGEKIDLTDTDVSVEVGLNDIDISDEQDIGGAIGNIVSIIYKGDHYQVIVRTDENEEDYVLDTEYTWNENDRVSVSIPAAAIRMKLKAEEKR